MKWKKGSTDRLESPRAFTVLLACTSLPRPPALSEQTLEPTATPLNTPVPERALVLDRGGPPETPSQYQLFVVDPARGEVEEFVSSDRLGPLIAAGDSHCPACNPFLLAPDGHTLIGVRASAVEERQQGDQPWSIYEAQVVRLDGRTGELTEGPVFARSGISWGWTPAGISPDGRSLYLSIPNNPRHASEHPLHSRHGIAVYDLQADQLSEQPLTSLTAWRAYPSSDGEGLYVCCWVDWGNHPHPGLYGISAATGDFESRAVVPALAEEVHLTRLAPAGDGRHFYALRPSGEWWLLDAEQGAITASGTLATQQSNLTEDILALHGPAAAYAKGGEYETAAGDIVVAPGQRLYIPPAGINCGFRHRLEADGWREKAREAGFGFA